VFYAYVTLSEEHYSCVGSGDCLAAVITRAMQHEMAPQEIARWRVACGAAKCLREGLGMFYKNDVDTLLNEVVLKEIIL
jgi:tagatose 6-phosphate kinase